MSEKNKFPYMEEEKWDAEKALEKRMEIYRSTEERIEHKKPIAQRTQATVRRTRQPSKKKKRANIKGWLILGSICVAIIVIFIGFISLLVSLFSSDDNEIEAVQATITEMVTETESEIEEVDAATFLERAERLAASYDYDAAIAALQEYGEDWQTQDVLSQAFDRYTALRGELLRWEDTTTIPHIFVRAVIVDPVRAFDGDGNEEIYNQNMITVNELRTILQKLYDDGFVLINMHDMVKNTATDGESTEFEQGDIYLPEGKKPIVISQEDVNYYSYRVDGPDDDELPDAEGDGFACQLLLDDSGNLTCKYIDADGNILYGAYDFVPIVEEFVQEHPDFSYRGAKGMIAVTGMEGVFGFRTHPDWEDVLGEDAYLQEIRQAQAVAQKLKDNGWEIASQGYSKIFFADSSADVIKENLRKWKNQVEPIVGKTDILVYPYGSDIGGAGNYSGEKFKVLTNEGYKLFCGMDSSQYWVQLQSNYMRQGRRPIDGYRMEYGAKRLSDLFDVNEVFDEDRPRPVPSV